MNMSPTNYPYFERKDYIRIISHCTCQGDATSVPVIVLDLGIIACKGHVAGLLNDKVDTRFVQDILELRTCPGTIHYRTITPINTRHLFEEGTHSMSAETSTLQGASDFVLLISSLEVT